LIANDALAYFFIDQWQYSRRFYTNSFEEFAKGIIYSIKIEMRTVIQTILKIIPVRK
jgi:hypothetical protein